MSDRATLDSGGVDLIERAVEADKRELERAWTDLQTATRTALNPARPLAANRWPALTACFGLGLWLGLRS